MRFLALRQQMIADGILQGLPFHSDDLQVLHERATHEGTSFILVTLPLLGRALDHCLVTGHFTCPANFAMRRNTHLPRLFYSIFKRVIDDSGDLLVEPCTLSMYFLRQILLFDSKLISEPTSKQKDTAVEGFALRQAALRCVRLPIGDPILQRARWLLGRVLRGLDLSVIYPGHGPGVVAERLSREERWDFKSWPLKAEKYYPYLIYGTPSARACLERGTGVPLLKRMVTRCCLVPKDFRGPRLISAEPTVNQYLQQGQMKAIMHYVEYHPVLSRSIRLQDQTYNQRKAMKSYEDNTTTLDLSDASDTVSAALVWYLFAEVPLLRRQLMSTRSDFLSYNGREIRISAFAPMGSATCFPIETLVFWALSIASLGHVRRLSGLPDELEALSLELAVFGDDIIIPSEAYPSLQSILTRVGCKVNVSKTCNLTPFRESCGTEWYNGTDVTIIRNKRYHYDDQRKFSNHPVLLGLQRKFFLRGLYSTANLCTDWAREIYPVCTIPISRFPLGFGVRSPYAAKWSVYGGSVLHNLRGSRRCKAITEELSGHAPGLTPEGCSAYFFRFDFAVDKFPCAIGWTFDHCVKLPFRWNKDYQRMEIRVPMSFQSHKSWSSEGYGRLFARLSSDVTERFTNRVDKTRLVWAYIPHY